MQALGFETTLEPDTKSEKKETRKKTSSKKKKRDDQVETESSAQPTAWPVVSFSNAPPSQTMLEIPNTTALATTTTPLFPTFSTTTTAVTTVATATTTTAVSVTTTSASTTSTTSSFANWFSSRPTSGTTATCGVLENAVQNFDQTINESGLLRKTRSVATSSHGNAKLTQIMSRISDVKLPERKRFERMVDLFQKVDFQECFDDWYSPECDPVDYDHGVLFYNLLKLTYLDMNLEVPAASEPEKPWVSEREREHQLEQVALRKPHDYSHLCVPMFLFLAIIFMMEVVRFRDFLK